MKRFLSVLIALAMVLSFAACKTRPGQNEVVASDAPADASEEPSEASEVTEEPSEEPSEEPAPQGIADYCAALENDVPATVDLDFDGIEDTVTLHCEQASEWDNAYSLSIVRGADPDNPTVYEVDYAYDCFAWIVDCDPTDSRLEVMLSYVQDSEDWTSAAMRLNDEGTKIDTFEDYISICITKELPFTSENGFNISRQADVFGTYFLETYAKVTNEGFSVVNDYTYPVYDSEYYTTKLLREMEVTIVNEDGSLGEGCTVPAGQIVVPYMTDLASYLDLKLEDGRIGRVSIEIRTSDEEWGIYLNGVNQDEYAQIPYAD